MAAERLDGKTAIVTGASSGIGLETARGLAARGARVIMACRNRQKAEQALLDIQRDTGSSKIEVKLLDLASLKSVRKFADDVNSSVDRVDILVNNAGVFTKVRELTEDGYETHFAVNHLGPFLLTYLLLDKLRSSAPSRIVIVSSEGHKYGKLDFKDLQSQRFSPIKTYSRSKTANILHAVQLARILQGSGVTTYCLHPGVVTTDLARDFDNNSCFHCCFRCMMCVTCNKMLTSEDGAATSLYCCTETSIAEHTGRYYDNMKESRAQSFATCEKNAKRLWEVSMEMCGLTLPEKNGK